MSVEEIATAIDSVDRRLNKNASVPVGERTINLTGAYVRYGWGDTPTPLNDDARRKLKLDDKSGDKRWSKHFTGNQRDLAIYRSQIGFYWCLRFDGAMREHLLENVGSAAEVERRFGG